MATTDAECRTLFKWPLFGLGTWVILQQYSVVLDIGFIVWALWTWFARVQKAEAKKSEKASSISGDVQTA